MREAIHRVLETEKEAKRLIEIAKSEADAILAEAKRQSQQLTAAIQNQTRAEIKRIIEQQTKEAEEEKKERLELAAAALEKEIQLDPETKAEAVKAVVRCVCGVD